MLTAGFFQSFLKFTILHANHITFMILTSILYLFTETLVIFFFVGTGMGIKETVLDLKLDPQFRQRSIALKRKVFPPLLLNMFFMLTLFVMVGAVDTGLLPLWLYALFFLGCLFHWTKSKHVQNKGVRETVDLFLEMSRLRK